MQDNLTILNMLCRPRLLIRTARIGAGEYSRKAHLPRLLGYGRLPHSGPALDQLIALEAVLNDQRKCADSTYSVARHVDILIAMMGEARIIRTMQTS